MKTKTRIVMSDCTLKITTVRSGEPLLQVWFFFLAILLHKYEITFCTWSRAWELPASSPTRFVSKITLSTTRPGIDYIWKWFNRSVICSKPANEQPKVYVKYLLRKSYRYKARIYLVVIVMPIGGDAAIKITLLMTVSQLLSPCHK